MVQSMMPRDLSECRLQVADRLVSRRRFRRRRIESETGPSIPGGPQQHKLPGNVKGRPVATSRPNQMFVVKCDAVSRKRRVFVHCRGVSDVERQTVIS